MTKDWFKGYQAQELSNRRELLLEKVLKSAIIDLE